MDQPELSPQLSPKAALDEPAALGEEVRLLRKYLVVTLTATIVVAFCFNAFLYRLDRSTRGQIVQLKKMRSELEQSVGTSLASFLNQVVSYASKNPDVAQLLASKYGIKPPASNAPAIAPAPAGGAAPKK